MLKLHYRIEPRGIIYRYIYIHIYIKCVCHVTKYKTVLYVMLFMHDYWVFEVVSEVCYEHHGDCVYNEIVS